MSDHFRKVLALSFYSSRERPVIHKRGWKKEKKKEKNKREEKEFRRGVVLLPLPVGPDGPIDDGDLPTLPPSLPSVLCTGVMGQSWCSIPPGWTVWSTDSSYRGHAGVGSTV
jgi:hypothetical protein